MNVPSLAPQCPWYGLSEIAKPNVKWCEASMCGWITEPANTWSNASYLLVAFFIYQHLKSSPQKNAKSFAPAAIFCGLASFIYHASYTFVFQILDFVAMFVFLGLPIIYNLNQMKIITKKNMMKVFYAIVGFCTSLVLILTAVKVPIQGIVLVMIVGLLFSEFYLFKKRPSGTTYKPLFLATGFIASAATFSILDITRTMCDPHNHFVQGHAIWHLLSATALYFAFLYYNQFELKEKAGLEMGEEIKVS